MKKYVTALLVIKDRNNPTKLNEEIKKDNEVYINSAINNNDAHKSRKCVFCKLFIHRASYAKHLKSKNYLENEKKY